MNKITCENPRFILIEDFFDEIKDLEVQKIEKLCEIKKFDFFKNCESERKLLFNDLGEIEIKLRFYNNELDKQTELLKKENSLSIINL